MIRKATAADLPLIMPLYEGARKKMRESGNMTQWSNGYPSESLILNDIEAGDFYVMEDSGSIIGAFSFIIGKEPTYSTIEGSWPNSNPYGTIHRLVSSGLRKGIGDECIRFCRKKIPVIRIDTHKDNKAMLTVIGRNDFVYCGIIHVADGTPRLAFQSF